MDLLLNPPSVTTLLILGLVSLVLLIALVAVVVNLPPPPARRTPMIAKLTKALGLHLEPALVLSGLASILIAIGEATKAGGVHGWRDIATIALPIVAGLFTRGLVTPTGKGS